MMVTDLFSTLSYALDGTPAFALIAAFAWGVLSLVLSPCHLTSIPLIVGFIGGQTAPVSRRRAFRLSLLFTLGILITIAIIGIATAALGRMMGYVGAWANYVVAVIFFAVGLNLLDVLPMPWSGPAHIAMKRRGLMAAFLLGLVFGIALGPCTFAFMAPVLGASLKVSGDNMTFGLMLLLTYGIGHGAMIVLAGTSTDSVQRLLNWNARSNGGLLFKRLCGLLVLLGGLYLVYIAP